MIILRRILAIVLAFMLVILFIPMLLVFRVNSTVGNPNFYVEQLRRADIYNFLYSDVLPCALDKALMGGTGSGGSDNFSWAKPYLTTIAKQTLPPDWLQAQAEQLIKSVMPYALGDTQSFAVNIPLKGRVEAAASAIKNALHQEGVMPKLYDQAVDSFTGSGAKDLPLSLTSSDIKSILRTVLPPDWVLKQLDAALDETVPYFTGDKEHFTVRLNLMERLDPLKAVVTDMLSKPQTYDYICQQVIVPPIRQGFQQINIGVTASDAEILSLVKQAVPLSWYQGQVTGVVGQIFAYLSGTQPNLAVTVSVADRKSAIADAVGKFIDQKLESTYNSLPLATPAQAAQLLANPPSTLPAYRLPGVSYSDLKSLLHLDIAGLFARLINTVMPDQLTLTEAQLSSMLGSIGGSNPLMQAKDWLQKGLGYTDQDLRATMGTSQGTLDTIRQAISSGFTFTEKDFRNWINAGGSGDANEFDSVRTILGTTRRWLMLVWLIPTLILAAIGLLGGRRWSTKLVWAAAALAVTAFITFIIFGPVFSAVVQPQINTALNPATVPTDVLEASLLAKGAAMAQNAINSFVGGLSSQAIILLVLALALIVVGSIWYRRQKTPANPQGSETNQTPNNP